MWRRNQGEFSPTSRRNQGDSSKKKKKKGDSSSSKKDSFSRRFFNLVYNVYYTMHTLNRYYTHLEHLCVYNVCVVYMHCIHMYIYVYICMCSIYDMYCTHREHLGV